jgi:uncharacterized membrane protein
MTIRLAPRIGPFVFFRVPYATNHRGVLGTLIYLGVLVTIMPMVWMCQLLWWVAKLIVLGTAKLVRQYRWSKAMARARAKIAEADQEHEAV